MLNPTGNSCDDPRWILQDTKAEALSAKPMTAALKRNISLKVVGTCKTSFIHSDIF